jgi:hypothetical protein
VFHLSTSFDTIKKRFFNKITDPDLASLLPDTIDSIVNEFLISATTRFQKCYKDINDYDTTLQQFNIDLNQVEIEILASWMVYEWTNQHTMRAELLKQSMSSKDYAMYSQANHLDKMILLKQQLYVETNQMILDYTYDSGKIDDLR